MSSKCSGCGYYTLACQCKKDDNYCACGKVISNCSCTHTNHYKYEEHNEDNHSYGNNNDSFDDNYNDNCGGGDD